MKRLFRFHPLVFATCGVLLFGLVGDAGGQAPTKPGFREPLPRSPAPPPCTDCADLTLGPCEVRCDDGTGYSASICATRGYRTDYNFMATPVPTMKNAGKKAASFPAGAKLWSVDGQSTSGALAPSTGLYLPPGVEAPGPNQPVKVLVKPAPGTYKVTFQADPDNLIAETSEGNNVSECTWTVVPVPPGSAPDLTITQVTISPTSGSRSTTFEHTVTVKNVGNDLSPGFNTKCQPGSSWNSAGLAAGAAFTRTYPIPNTATMPAGTHTATCVVTPFFAEVNKSNNSVTATFTITP